MDSKESSAVAAGNGHPSERTPSPPQRFTASPRPSSVLSMSTVTTAPVTDIIDDSSDEEDGIQTPRHGTPPPPGDDLSAPPPSYDESQAAHAHQTRHAQLHAAMHAHHDRHHQMVVSELTLGGPMHDVAVYNAHIEPHSQFGPPALPRSISETDTASTGTTAVLSEQEQGLGASALLYRALAFINALPPPERGPKTGYTSLLTRVIAIPMLASPPTSASSSNETGGFDEMRVHPIQFARLYARPLSNVAVTPAAQAAFLDGLNSVSRGAGWDGVTGGAASSAAEMARLLDGIGNVPKREWVGAYVQRSNALFWAPRGLRAEIVSLAELVMLVSVPERNDYRAMLVEDVLSLMGKGTRDQADFDEHDVDERDERVLQWAERVASAMEPWTERLERMIPARSSITEEVDAVARGIEGFDMAERNRERRLDAHGFPVDEKQPIGDPSTNDEQQESALSKFWNPWGLGPISLGPILPPPFPPRQRSMSVTREQEQGVIDNVSVFGSRTPSYPQTLPLPHYPTDPGPIQDHGHAPYAPHGPPFARVPQFPHGPQLPVSAHIHRGGSVIRGAGPFARGGIGGPFDSSGHLGDGGPFGRGGPFGGGGPFGRNGPFGPKGPLGPRGPLGMLYRKAPRHSSSSSHDPENWSDWSQRMEQWGNEYGKRWQEWGVDYGKAWQEWAEAMEKKWSKGSDKFMRSGSGSGSGAGSASNSTRDLSGADIAHGPGGQSRESFASFGSGSTGTAVSGAANAKGKEKRVEQDDDWDDDDDDASSVSSMSSISSLSSSSSDSTLFEDPEAIFAAKVQEIEAAAAIARAKGHKDEKTIQRDLAKDLRKAEQKRDGDIRKIDQKIRKRDFNRWNKELKYKLRVKEKEMRYRGRVLKHKAKRMRNKGQRFEMVRTAISEMYREMGEIKREYAQKKAEITERAHRNDDSGMSPQERRLRYGREHRERKETRNARKMERRTERAEMKAARRKEKDKRKEKKRLRKEERRHGGDREGRGGPWTRGGRGGRSGRGGTGGRRGSFSSDSSSSDSETDNGCRRGGLGHRSGGVGSHRGRGGGRGGGQGRGRGRGRGRGERHGYGDLGSSDVSHLEITDQSMLFLVIRNLE